MKRITGVCLALGFVLAMAGAVSAQDVTIDYDKSADFSKYKTFSAQVKTTWNTPFAEKRALDEVVKTLIAKGWTQVDPAKADAMVMIHGATQTKRDLNTFYGGGGLRFGGGMATTSVSEFQVGSMIVDIADSKTKNLLWRGVGTDELSDKADKNQAKMVKGTAKMFKNFPPTPGKT
jgi:hypothetical protein